MKNTYLFLTVLGFIAPNIFVAIVSIETGNILLWARPLESFAGMFSNSISSAFAVDLLVVVLIFFIWSYHEAKRYAIKRLWLIWLLTMLFGLAGTFPLFLYMRERRLKMGGEPLIHGLESQTMGKTSEKH